MFTKSISAQQRPLPGSNLNGNRIVGQQQNFDSNTAATNEPDNEFNPYRGSRHDQFDWSLTKVINLLT